MRIVIGMLVAVVLTGCGQAANNDVALGGQPAAESPSDAGGAGQAAPGDGDSMSMCIEGATECNDTVVTTEPALDDSCTVSSDGETFCPDSGSSGSAGGGTSPSSPGTGEILCEGTEPTAAAPPGTDCSAPPEPEGEEIKPAPEGLQDVHTVGWERHTADGRLLTVHWWTGVEPCSVLHSVRVSETDERVTVTLREGSADPDAACIAIAKAVKTTVRLEAALGDRKVIDGAD